MGWYDRSAKLSPRHPPSKWVPPALAKSRGDAITRRSHHTLWLHKGVVPTEHTPTQRSNARERSAAPAEAAEAGGRCGDRSFGETDGAVALEAPGGEEGRAAGGAGAFPGDSIRDWVRDSRLLDG